MADFRAIEAVSEALVHLLRLSYRPDDFGSDLRFEVYDAADFADKPVTAGASLFLYRITANGSYRTPPGRRAPDGGRYQTRLPVDLHYLLTIWARDASLQHRVAGWVLRVLEDAPLLPHALFETVAPGVFQPDESVEVLLDDVPSEDLLRIWEALVQEGVHLSLPYRVRNVQLESRQSRTEGEPAQERLFDLAALNA